MAYCDDMVHNKDVMNPYRFTLIVLCLLLLTSLITLTGVCYIAGRIQYGTSQSQVAIALVVAFGGLTGGIIAAIIIVIRHSISRSGEQSELLTDGNLSPVSMALM